MKAMDFWRLADELSVIDASILITGNNPEESYPTFDNHGDPIFDDYGRHVTRKKLDYDGFEATFSALKNAIYANKLRAQVHLLARVAPYKTLHLFGGESHQSDSYIDGGESVLNFKHIIQVIGASGLIETVESLWGFPLTSAHASLAHAQGHIHHPWRDGPAAA